MAETPAAEAAGLFCSKGDFWLPEHQSNLSPRAVHPPAGLSCSSICFGCLPEKESEPGKCSWILQGETRAFRSPGSHSEDTVRIKSMLKMLQLLPTHKNSLRVTLLQPVAHLDLPTDRKEHSRLRATPLTEELSHCKIKVTPCPQDRGNLEISGLQEEIWSPNKIQQGFPQSA